MKKNFVLHGCILISIMLTNISTDIRFLHENDKPAADEVQSTTASVIDGAWKLVYFKRNDTLVDVAKAPQFKMFSNGSFALVGHDSSGKITYAGHGKFELQGTNYTETFFSHTHGPYVGAIDWQIYEVRGDTLYSKGFSKVIIGGREDPTFPKIEEKRVKVKW